MMQTKDLHQFGGPAQDSKSESLALATELKQQVETYSEGSTCDRCCRLRVHRGRDFRGGRLSSCATGVTSLRPLGQIRPNECSNAA